MNKRSSSARANASHSAHKAETRSSPNELEFSSDRPLDHPGRDRLGFQVVASRLAASIARQSPNDGYVIAIDGTWGSGKSTLIDFVTAELHEKLVDRLEIVKFAPWIVGNKEGMLVELMSDLLKCVESIARNASRDNTTLASQARAAGENIKKYTVRLGRVAAPLAKAAGSFIPFGGVVSDVIEGISDAVDAVDLSETVDALKVRLVDSLGALDRKIIVIIDDLDRLEPNESAEVLRLVRAVADFPNVIYLLSYDADVLAKNLRTALNVDDGKSFLRKMVQVSFKVPQPEAFDLRRWFEEECLAFYVSVLRTTPSEDQLRRLQQVCGLEGQFIQTPRDVVRGLNALKLYWPSVANEVDYADMVWLQLIRLQNEDFYRWIEKYVTDYFAVAGGAMVDKEGRIEDAKGLKRHMTSESTTSPRSPWVLRDLLPGLNGGLKTEDDKLLYNLQNKNETARFQRDRRLASSQHYRFFFSFARPAGALGDQEFFSILDDAANSKSISERMDDLIGDRRPQGGTMMSVFIDRLMVIDDARLPVDAVPTILISFSNHMDDLARAQGRGQWGVIWDWRSARDLTRRLLSRLDSKSRKDTVQEVFSKGKSLGWLMAELIRDELFAHGIQGKEPKPKDEWLLTDEELEDATSLLSSRLSGKDRKRLLEAPQLLIALFAWQEWSEGKEVKKWIEEQFRSDDALLKLLAGCRGWMQSDKTYYPLNKRDLKHLMDYDAALRRLNQISAKSRSSSRVALANDLLEAARIGRDDVDE